MQLVRTVLAVSSLVLCGQVLAIDPPAVLSPCGAPWPEDPALPIFLTWQDVSGAADYQVQVSFLDPTFQAISIDMTTSGSTFLDVGNGQLYYDALYYWRVRATDGNTWSAWSTICDFSTTIIPIPPAPMLLVPANGSTNIQAGSVGLQWSVLFGFDVELQVATNASFSSPTVINNAGYQYTLTGLLFAQTYYWRVRESNVSGTSPWSTVWSFSTGTVVTAMAISMNLQGPWNSSTLMMNDDLRVANLIPSNEPYSSLGFANIENTGAAIGPSVLSVTGPNAIVDWVLLEFRDPAGLVVLERHALVLQRDGDVVMPDGNTPMIDLPQGQVKISMRHRNHLGCMAAATINNYGSSITLDLTSTSTALFGTDAMSIASGVRALWCGDVTNDGTVAYTGNGNDRDPVLIEIGGSVPTNTTIGYMLEDVNLNGVVKYTGPANDRDPILITIGGGTPTAIRVEQLP